MNNVAVSRKGASPDYDVVVVGAGVGGGITITDTASIMMSAVLFPVPRSLNRIVVELLSAVNVRK